MGRKGFFSRTVGLQKPVCDKDTIVYPQTKDKGADDNIKDIKFDMEQPHNPKCQDPCQENRNYGDYGKGQATVEQKQDQQHYQHRIPNKVPKIVLQVAQKGFVHLLPIDYQCVFMAL